MKKIELKIPNLGEAEDTEIIEISVKKGDMLRKNDPIIVLESEKAAMEVPSDFNGKITEIFVKEGENVSEGKIFAEIEIEDNEDTKEEVSKELKAKTPQEISAESNESRNNPISTTKDFSGINTGPAVRKIARELNIDLSKIIGSGRNKMITKDDLKDYIHSVVSSNKTNYGDLKTLEAFGDYEIENQTKIRKAGAKNLQNSWQAIPHVTHFEESNITIIEKQRKDLNKISDIKITPLAYIVKATALALEEFPLMNCSLVDEGKLMLKKYINIGIAVATDQGLVVPNIKDANKLNIDEIAKTLLDISKKAREKKLLKEDIEGSTFTISSLGSIGGTGFTPIINPPEVGIIGVSRTKNSLAMHNKELIEQIMLPLTLSYDHRVINGVDAGNFMHFIKTRIEKGL